MVDITLSGMFIFRGEELLLLHRTDHDHYEKPGGKLEPHEVKDMSNPTIEELLYRAKKELEEEIGGIEVDTIEYFGFVDFTVPGGRSGRAHTFTAQHVSGIPYPREEKFDEAVFIPLDELEHYTISPDHKRFLPKLKARK